MSVKKTSIECPGNDLEGLSLRINDILNAPKKPDKEGVYAEARKRHPKISEEALEEIWRHQLFNYDIEKGFYDTLCRYGKNSEEVRKVLGQHVLECGHCARNYVEKILKEDVEDILKREDCNRPKLGDILIAEEKRIQVLTKWYYETIKLADSQRLRIL